MLFRADDIGISLRIASDESQITLKGQILGEGFNGCEIVLDNDGSSVLCDYK